MRKEFAIFLLLALLLVLVSCADREVIEQPKLTESQTESSTPQKTFSDPNQIQVEPTYLNASALEGIERQACGDGQCAEGENECSCVKDCGACEQKDAGICEYWQCTANNACVKQQQTVCCGDAVCSNTETCGSCATDCCIVSKTLADFPNITDRFAIVVGAQAEAQDIVTATNLANALKQLGITFEDTLLDSEVPDLTAGNFIVIGTPCANLRAAELIGLDSTKLKKQCLLIPEGEGQIRLVPTSAASIALLITGGSSRDVEDAAERLINYQEQPLSGMIVKT